MDDVKAKQQVIEKIKASTSILVTVSNDPSVDALSAALGLTLLLDKLEKHPTTIFSGTIPPAISFLEPEKTFDNTTDSLRDFIIALDKEKADHLRYKVEGDSVKIYITPYKTTITSDDLEFSQGDFNVELVIALGVDNPDHLDAALENHGQILHDATVITVTAGDQTSTLGGIDWHDAQASGLSEMIVGLAEALKSDKTKSLMDGSIATALLTGIVAQTDRFSNTHTTSKVMTMAAQLMTAGADQQLIAAKLQAGSEISETSEAPDKEPEKVEDEEPVRKDILNISHDPNETLEEMDKRVKAAEQAEAAKAASSALEAQATPTTDPVEPIGEVKNAYALDDTPEPTFGGTLNATTEQAAEDHREEIENSQNHTILKHSYVGSTPTETPMSGTLDHSTGFGLVGEGSTPTQHDDTVLPPATGEPMHSAYSLDEEPAPAVAPTIEPLPATPADLGLPMPPPLPDFSAGTPPAPLGPLPATEQPARLGDILAPEPPVAGPVPPVPPVAPETPSIPPVAPLAPPVAPPTPPVADDPAQFKIPGQS